MNSPERQCQLQHRKSAIWMLLAILVWVLQPVGTSLFCHTDAAHDHSAPASAMHEGKAHNHTAPHAHGTSATQGSTPAARNASSKPSEPAHEACCCQPQNTSVTVAAAVSYSASNSQESATPTPIAVLAFAYASATPPTVSSRAGPDVASLYSQLCRSSFSNRAPPFSA